MNIFLFITSVTTLLALFLVFFSSTKNLSLISKIFFSLISITSIATLLFMVVDFTALDRQKVYSQDISTKLQTARQAPNNIATWNDLGRSYLLDKEYVHAYMAYTESEQLDSYVGLGIDEQQARIERLKWLTGLAEARIQAQGGGVDEEANEFIQRSLEIDEQYPKALWYGGLAAAQRANYSRAQELWNKLVAQNPPDALKAALQKRLNSLEGLLETDAASQLVIPWKLNFKLIISDRLLQSQTPQSRVYASLRQIKQSPPIIAKSFDVKQLLSKKDNILSLTQNDKISGMAVAQSIDWTKSSTLTLIWAKNGMALDAENVRLELDISQQNLNSVFEYTLE